MMAAFREMHTIRPTDGPTVRRCSDSVTNERARLSSVRKKNSRLARSHSSVLQNAIVQGSADINAK